MNVPYTLIPRLFTLPAVLGLCAATALNAHAATDAEITFFETDIRPILATNCYECHGPDKQESNLRLDHISTIMQGGDYGPALVAGNPAESNIVEGINWSDPDFQMPPKKKLGDADIASLTKWIEMGAPWPEEDLPGASTAPTSDFDLQQRKSDHWAWQPIQNPTPPVVADAAWSRNPVDAFIRTTLDTKNLTPAASADKRTLIRRVYFDLIGLPPSVEAVEAFVGNDSPDAYENLVDELLANPAFGERWGRHWLDITRFAETYGHEGDYPINHAWQYRDYVIRALNNDLPYDQLVREHVAGDLLETPRINPDEGFNESIVATGWWFMHQATHAPVDVVKDEADRIDNQLDVLGKAFLGMTVACARCHDHKFDAISTKDYYSMTSYLRSSRQQFAFLDRFGAIEEKAETLAEKHAKAITAVNKVVPTLAKSADDIEPYLLALKDIAGDAFDIDAEKIEIPEERIAEVATAHGLDLELTKRWVEAVLHKRTADANHPFHLLAKSLSKKSLDTNTTQPDSVLYASFDSGSFDDWTVHGEAFGDSPTTQNEWSPANDATTLVPAGVVHSALTSTKLRGVLRSPTFKLTHDAVLYKAAGRRGTIRLVINQYQLREFNGLLFGGSLSTINNGSVYAWDTQISGLYKYRGLDAYIEIIDDGDGWIAVDEIRFSDKHAGSLDTKASLETYGESLDDFGNLITAYANWARDGFDTWNDGKADPLTIGYLNFLLEKDLIDRKKFDKKLAGIADDMTEIEKDIPEPVVVLAMTAGPPQESHVFIRGNHTSPGDPTPSRFLEALGGRGPEAGSVSRGRLQLAGEILDPQNPLTARVMVNRIWHHHFGRGIVESVDNFGVLGRTPSHPELLDYLATQFRDNGWSIKQAIRQVVTSETYAMSSDLNDPKIEEVDPANFLLHRQNIRRLEGEIIRDAVLAVAGELDTKMYGNSIPAHLYPFMTNHRRPGESGPVDAERRRSIYMRVQRNFLSPMMLAFDMPLPDTTIGMRTVSNVPAQSLILMNDPFIASQSEAWAKRLIEKHPDSVDARITSAYLDAFGRTPTQAESGRIKEFIEQQAKAYEMDDAAILSDATLWKDFCQVLYMSKEFIYIG